jgi:cytochrome P450
MVSPLPLAQDSVPVSVRRPALGMLIRVIRNPLDALPPAVFDAPLVHSEVLGRQRFHVLDPALIQEALVNHADCLTKGPELKRSLGAALGQGLLTAEGAHWRWQRQSAAPIFRHERLVAFLPAILAVAGKARDQLLASPNAGEIDIAHEMMRLTFAIIVETMLSGQGRIDVARVERAVTDYLEPTGWVFALSLLDAPKWVPYPGRLKASRASRYLRAEILRIAAGRRHTAARSDDLIDLLLAASDPETGRTMTDDEITDNLLTFITAGHETTALALAWTLDLLSRHPDCEARAVAEIDAVTGGLPVQPDHIARLTYVKQVFQEGMRLYPPAPIIARAVTRDFTLANRPVPTGSMVYVPIYALHRHSALWSQPENFDPDRFSAETLKERHRFAYLPFGAGPRICIGSAFAMLEGVAILATLLQTLHLQSVAASPPKPRMRLTLRPATILGMRAERRMRTPTPAAETAEPCPMPS